MPSTTTSGSSSSPSSDITLNPWASFACPLAAIVSGLVMIFLVWLRLFVLLVLVMSLCAPPPRSSSGGSGLVPLMVVVRVMSLVLRCFIIVLTGRWPSLLAVNLLLFSWFVIVIVCS